MGKSAQSQTNNQNDLSNSAKLGFDDFYNDKEEFVNISTIYEGKHKYYRIDDQ